MVPSGRYGKTGHGSLPRRHGAPSRRQLRVSDTRRCRRAGAPARIPGTRTFDDPITPAVGYEAGDEFPVGTVFHVPLVRAYSLVEDRCGGCSALTVEADHSIDLRVGSDPDASCTYEITGAHAAVRDAGPGWDVEYRPYELGSDGSLFGGTPKAA